MAARWHLLRAWAVVASICALLAASPVVGRASSVPSRPAEPTPSPELATAFSAALAAYVQQQGGNVYFQPGPIHQSGDWAYQFAQEVDVNGQATRESFVALLGHREPGGWQVLAPDLAAPADYNALLADFPADLLDLNEKAFLRLPEVQAKANLSGHRLPWPGGQSAWVTQKDVAPYHMNQIDFDIHGAQAPGDVYATKAGTVVFVKECSNEGGCGPDYSGKQNLVVVQHGTNEYTWYLHLAYNSVPVQVGDHVDLGTKIGVEGETGYACGIHLHYMASTSGPYYWTDPNDPNDSPWPSGGITAVDFDEYAWASLVEWQTYTSQNYPPAQPSPLQVTVPLVVTPSDPEGKLPVTASFTLRNTGSEPITLAQLTAAARGPGCSDWDCAQVVDWPALSNITLQPGEERLYWGQRVFSAKGVYFAEPAYSDGEGVWHYGLDGSNRVTFAFGLDKHIYLPCVLNGP